MKKYEGIQAEAPVTATEQLPHNQRDRIIQKALDRIIQKGVVDEELYEKLESIERAYYKKHRTGFDADMLLDAAFEAYREQGEEHVSKKILASYEEWKRAHATTESTPE